MVLQNHARDAKVVDSHDLTLLVSPKVAPKTNFSMWLSKLGLAPPDWYFKGNQQESPFWGIPI